MAAPDTVVDFAEKLAAFDGQRSGDVGKVLRGVGPGVVAGDHDDRSQGDAATVGHLDVELGLTVET